MAKISVPEELTTEKLNQLTVNEVYDLVNTVIRPLPKETRTQYMTMIRTVFDFRSISPTKSYLRKDMMAYGYKFFEIPNNDSMIVGIKRKV